MAKRKAGEVVAEIAKEAGRTLLGGLVELADHEAIALFEEHEPKLSKSAWSQIERRAVEAVKRELAERHGHRVEGL